MKPEDQARTDIDRQLIASGWLVQDQAAMNIMAGPGVAVREFKLRKGHGRADYLLYVDGKVIGVIEAKPAGHTLKGVELQSAMYTEGLPDGIPLGETCNRYRNLRARRRRSMFGRLSVALPRGFAALAIRRVVRRTEAPIAELS